jgi:hypothetical protein
MKQFSLLVSVNRDSHDDLSERRKKPSMVSYLIFKCQGSLKEALLETFDIRQTIKIRSSLEREKKRILIF